jgi:hypothetical protein
MNHDMSPAEPRPSGSDCGLPSQSVPVPFKDSGAFKQNRLFGRASIANGLLILLSVLLGGMEPTRWIGIGFAAFMGVGLVFSGMTGYCGWVRLFSKPSRPDLRG